MKKTKIILVVITSVLLIACIVVCSLLFGKTYDPSNNDDILFIERYLKMEFPQSKRIKIVEGDKNSGLITLELTVRKAELEKFLDECYIQDFSDGIEGLPQKQEDQILKLGQSKENSVFFSSKNGGGYLCYCGHGLEGVCYPQKGTLNYIIYATLYTPETEEELIKARGEKWYVPYSDKTRDGSAS